VSPLPSPRFVKEGAASSRLKMAADGRTRVGRDEQAEEGRMEESPPPSPPDAELVRRRRMPSWWIPELRPPPSDPGAPPATINAPPRIRSRTTARAAMAAARRRRGQLPRHLPPPVRARLCLLRRSRWVGLFLRIAMGWYLVQMRRERRGEER
jgi:hypothetical protein